MKKINIAVDGTAGSGKSTTFLKVSNIIGYNFIDTGLMYRALTWLCIYENVDFNDSNSIINKLTNLVININNNLVEINGNDVTKELQNTDIITNINKLTFIPAVRDKMVFLQKEMVKTKGNIMIGRDITSVVLPDAELKIFFDCSIAERARRRQKQNIASNINVDYQTIYDSIKARDESDKNREVGALQLVKDAWYFDSSGLSLDEAVKIIVVKINALTR